MVFPDFKEKCKINDFDTNVHQIPPLMMLMFGARFLVVNSIYRRKKKKHTS